MDRHRIPLIKYDEEMSRLCRANIRDYEAPLARLFLKFFGPAYEDGGWQVWDYTIQVTRLDGRSHITLRVGNWTKGWLNWHTESLETGAVVLIEQFLNERIATL